MKALRYLLAVCAAFHLASGLSIALKEEGVSGSVFPLFDSPRSIQLVPGKSYYILCDGNNGNPDWYQNGTTVSSDVVPNGVSGVYVTSSGDIETLRLQLFSESLVGQYVCQLDRTKFSINISTGNPVLIPSDVVIGLDIDRSTSNVPAIRVFGSGDPEPVSANYTWIFNGDVIFANGSVVNMGVFEFIVSDRISLGVDITNAFEGTYINMVTTDEGTASTTIILNVEAKPKPRLSVISPLNYETEPLAPGESITLNCSDSVGDPVPEFVWYLGSQVLSGDQDGISITTDNGGRVSYLTIEHVNFSMNGEVVMCEATNIVEDATVTNTAPETITLSILPIPVLNRPFAVTTTTISISSSVPSGTSYEVEWRRYVSIGCSDTNNSTIIETGNFTSYTIRDLEPGNRYIITVRHNGHVSNEVSATTIETTPTEAPVGLRPGKVTGQSIAVYWEEVPCLGRNGIITGYSLTLLKNGTIADKSVTLGGHVKQATINGLVPSTQYTVSVAAINGIGIGPTAILSISTLISSPSAIRAVQASATSITLTWTPPSPMGDIIGYRISYNGVGGGNSGSEDVSGGSTNTYTLTGLQNGFTYTISIVATSQTSTSDVVTVEVTLIPASGEVSVEVRSITATSISLSWSVASGSVSSWEVVWRETDRGTESLSGSLPGTSYTIDQLDSTTIYTVSVTATNVAGTTSSNTIFISTGEAGDCEAQTIISGVLGVLLGVVVITAVIVIVVLALRSRKQYYSTGTRASVGDDSKSLELSKPPEHTYEDLKELNTSSNEAYMIFQRRE